MKLNKVEELEALLEAAKTKTREIVDRMEEAGVPRLAKSYEFIGWSLDLILHFLKGRKEE